MIKTNAKRNRRQRKKLKVDEYRQWRFSVNFNHEHDVMELSNTIIDDLYDIAEDNNCHLYGFINSSDSKMAFHNKGLLDDGVRCQLKMADYLMNASGVSAVKVGYKEGEHGDI